MADQGRRPGEHPDEEPAPGLDEIRWAEPSGDEPTETVTIISSDDQPALTFGPNDTGPLPHWTEPPTGEVPKILLEDGSADDLAAWSSFANKAVWRDEHTDYDDEIDFAPLADGTRVGALDERPAPSDPFFEEYEPAPAEPEREEAPTRVTPIRTRRAPAARRAEEPGFTPTRGAGGRNLPLAVGVGVAIAAAALVLFWIGPAATMGLVVVVVVLAAIEFYEKLRERGYQPATLAGLVAVGSLPLAAYWRGEGALPLVVFLAFMAVIVWFLLSGGLESGPLPNTAVTMLGVVYLGLLGSYAALILQFSDGVSALLVLALGVVAYDVGGLFVGSAAGKTQLAPWISPNKTVEGLIGGALAVVLVVVLAKLAGIGPFSTSLGKSVQLAAVIAVAAPIGDLAASMMKRNLDVKDFGTILPGHGGVLDRFCSFLFVLPSVYYLALVLDLTAVAG